MSDYQQWQHVRYMTSRQQKRREAEAWDNRPPQPPAQHGQGWIAIQVGNQFVMPYPALFLPKPPMEEIYTAYFKHPKNRGKQ